MQFPILLAALAAIAQPTGDHLPVHLLCQVSGEAGCTADGICTGGGRRYDEISMTIDAETKFVIINDIGGRIGGPERLDFGQRRSVFWHPRLFGLSTIHVRPEASRDGNGMPYTVVELTNGSDLVEFVCRAT